MEQGHGPARLLGRERQELTIIRPARRKSRNQGSGIPPAAVRQEQDLQGNSPAEILKSLQKLPAEEQGVVIAQIVERQSTVHSGPLPAPADFEKYDKTLPGAAERILSMAEAEQKIRIDATQALTANDTRRIHSATIVSILLVLVAGLATWLGNAWIAVPLGVIGIVGSIARTLFNWWSRGRDPQDRDFP